MSEGMKCSYIHSLTELISVIERNILDNYFTVDISCYYILYVKTII